MNTSTLEKRVAAALKRDVSSADLAALVRETEEAIVIAETSAKLAREAALDPVASPDPKAARAAMEDAVFRVSRLETLLPRLQARYEQQRKAEYLAQWKVDCAELERERDALAAELRELYPAVTQLADLMARVAVHDGKLSQLHSRRPAGVSLHLRSAELVARGLDNFHRDQPPLSQNLQIPDFNQSNRLLFPVPQRRDVSMFAPLPYDEAYSDRWHAAQDRRAAEAAAEQRRVARFYEDQARKREERAEVRD